MRIAAALGHRGLVVTTGGVMALAQARGWLELSAEAFDACCRGSVVVERKRGAPAVLAHEDEAGRPLMTKIWRSRGAWPVVFAGRYPERFRRALGTLGALEVAVPVYRAHGRVRGSRTRFVIYEPIAGVPLRDLEGPIDLERLGAFVVRLHERGVYFRGLHLGNVIACPGGGFGLIDVQDVRFRRGPLGRRMRERNLGILCSHPRDLPYLQDRWSELVMAYCRSAGMSVRQTARMRDRVWAEVQRRGARRAARRVRRGLAPLPF